MRITITIFLALVFSVAKGQKIEYRNDSLFINNFFVDASINKTTLDSLLKSKGKTKTSKDTDKINPATGRKVVRTTEFYYDLGLFFRKYDNDTTQISVGIKLYRDTDPKKDKEKELTEPFKAELFIADNFINDKRTMEQLQTLKNCTVTRSYVSIGTYTYPVGGDIVYKESIIRISFDKQTNELTDVFIHHNFKDR